MIRLSIALIVLCTHSAWAQSVQDDWPSFLGPDRNGRSSLVGICTDWPAQGLPIIWQTPLGTGYAAPSIAGERLFHYDRRGDECILTCRNAKTGQELWHVSHATAYEDMLGYNNGPRCSPIVDGDRVYTCSAEGLLQCRAVADGELVWQDDTNASFGVVKNFFGVGSTPLVVGELLVANVGGSPPGEAPDVYTASGNVKANGSALVAWDKRTGKVRWQAGDDLASYASPVVANVDGTQLVLTLARGGIVAVDIATGQVAFTHPWRAPLLESVNASTPVVVGNQVFVSETYDLGSTLLKMSPTAVETIWSDAEKRRDKSLELHWNTAVYHDGHLYGSSGRHSGSAELRCVDWRTGRVAWSERGMGRCSLTYVDGHFICLGEDGIVRLLKATPQEYTEVARMEPVTDDGTLLLTEPAWAAPVIAHGRLYLRGNDRLVCFQLVADE